MNTNPPNFEMLPGKHEKKKRAVKKEIEKDTKNFKVQVQTAIAGLPEKIYHYKFRNLAACIDYCKKQYQNYLFCAVNDVCIVDNLNAYRINPEQYPNYLKLKTKTK